MGRGSHKVGKGRELENLALAGRLTWNRGRREMRNMYLPELTALDRRKRVGVSRDKTKIDRSGSNCPDMRHAAS